VGKKTELLQRLIDAVGDCEDTQALLDLAKEAEELLHPVRCSFCGKSQHKAKIIIAAPDDMNICDDCVELCNHIIESRKAEDG